MPAVAQGASPVITSASAFEVDEGVEPVATLTASDADGDALSWRLADSPGSDGAAFNLAENGDLSFIAATDYEVPGDADAWALGGADADTFTVAGGLIRFVDPPD